MEADIEMTCFEGGARGPQGKEYRQPPETEEGRETDSALEAPRKN